MGMEEVMAQIQRGNTLLPTKPFEKDDEHSLNVDCGHQWLMSQITEYQAPRT